MKFALQQSDAGEQGRAKNKSVPVLPENYLLSCYRYIELNPVTACMVEQPEQYRWSSFRRNALGEPDPLVTEHSIYTRLSSDLEARQAAYHDLFRFSLPDQDRKAIAECLTASHVLGSSRFKGQVEAALGRKVGYARAGRPGKAASCGESADS